MANQATHGKKTKILINGFDLSRYFKTADMEGTAELVESTCFDMTDKTYIPGFGDGKISLSGIWAAKDTGGDPDEVDDVLQAVLGVDTDNIVTIGQVGLSSAGLVTTICKVKEIKYSVQSPQNNLVSIMAEFQPSLGVRYALLHAALSARTTSANGTSQDSGIVAGTPSGAHVHLDTTGVAGTTPTLDVIVEDSANGTTWATIGTFPQVTAAGAKRLELTGTVRRYTRVSWTIGGTTPSFTFCSSLARL